MKHSFYKNVIASTLVHGLLLIALFVLDAKTQSLKQEIPSPANEKFAPAGGLIAPWRSSYCALKAPEMIGTICVGIGGDEYYNASIVRIFNSDGHLWRKLHLNLADKNYFWAKEDVTFRPLVSIPEEYPLSFILRVVAESPNWYEVEIDETTRETKFIASSDKAWSRTEWSGWLHQGKNFRLEKDHDPLADGPNGKTLEDSKELKFDRVIFVRAIDDWAYVIGFSPETGVEKRSYKGWIRWRKGREILVGCILNNYKISPSR